MDIGTSVIVATALGPITAVLITLWHQDRAQKYEAKHKLFITIMGHRKSNPPAYDWANALNLIHVVYAKHPKVLSAWNDLYDYVHVRPMDQKQYEHKNVELLTQMALALGYKTLSQTDMDKFYVPDAHATQTQTAFDLQQELLRVLKATDRLSTLPRYET